MRISRYIAAGLRRNIPASTEGRMTSPSGRDVPQTFRGLALEIASCSGLASIRLTTAPGAHRTWSERFRTAGGSPRAPQAKCGGVALRQKRCALPGSGGVDAGRVNGLLAKNCNLAPVPTSAEAA
jgi:hypothetical protein